MDFRVDKHDESLIDFVRKVFCLSLGGSLEEFQILMCFKGSFRGNSAIYPLFHEKSP